MPTPNQDAVFNTAMSGVSMNTLGYIFASVLMMVVFLWSAWIIFGHGKAWASSRMDLYQLLWSAMRAALLVMVIGYWATP